jgi:hypothetical protein
VPEAAPNSTCGVCHGQKSEHFDDSGKAITQHVFTEHEGHLVTQAQHQEQLRRQNPPTPQLIRLPGGGSSNEGGAINRLIEVLLDREGLSSQEALYIVGIGEKPPRGGQYFDPARRTADC